MRRGVPSPFTIAVLLTLFTAIMVCIIRPEPPAPVPRYEIILGGVKKALSQEEYEALAGKYHIPPAGQSHQQQFSFPALLQWWEQGFWELLEFAMQMVLILVLGHALALTPAVSGFIHAIARQCRGAAQAAAIVALASMAVALINWGLGLIFGAILARKVAEKASATGIRVNYPLLGAAGYAGMMVWHGGFSGSAPLKVAEPNHFLVAQTGIIPIDLTLLSAMNITVNSVLLLLVPALLFIVGSNIRHRAEHPAGWLPPSAFPSQQPASVSEAASRLDSSRLLAYLFAALILSAAVYKAFISRGVSVFSFINLNYINFLLLGIGILLHGNFSRYLRAIDEAVGGASGIIIQFPLYAGIMGIMKYSGLIATFSDWLAQLAGSTTLPLFTFMSAAVVNLFVPSGGGQWAVQGPLVVQTALELGSSVPKNIMALAYGDQLTNMIQPFWALPLLGITGLDAKDILPYSFLIMIAGGIVYSAALLIF
ncbi:MAG: short-chain fatty acids transporter [Chitinophagales bacterium]|nr:MAG: short-chain fatty acids transporter [Chitinophagales bacterium]